MSECGATEDPEDIGSGEEEEDDAEELGMEQSTPEKRARHAITGRGVTLQMLMADGIIQAGEGLLSLEYLDVTTMCDIAGSCDIAEPRVLFNSSEDAQPTRKIRPRNITHSGQKFTADLLSNGKIKSNETGQMFGSPSSWAIFCKKLVNPAKKSGCGWASVKYKGRKLDSWKTSWFRLVKPRKPNIPGAQSPARSVTSDMGMSSDGLSESESRLNEPVQKTDGNVSLLRNDSSSSGMSLLRNDSSMSLLSPASTAAEPNFLQDGVLDLTTKHKAEEKPVKESVRSSTTDVCYMGEQEEALNLSLKENPTPAKVTVKQEPQTDQSDFSKNDRKPFHYASLPERSQTVDQNLLVECEQFSAVSKIQPYTVSMSTNSLLLMDFHCHLTTSEVVGYLGGKWDQSTQHLSIQQAFPCRCRLGDSQNAPLIEEEIRASMKHQSMSLVGWYHSHPYCLPEPSIKDLDCQMSYQLRMKGAKSTYFPCVGMINSPYYGKSLRTESSLQMYMVMPPPDTSQSEYGIPMALKYSMKQNHSISEGLLTEMKKLADFYRGSPDWITFQHSWHPSITYLEKLKTSLNSKLPEDQSDHGNFLDFVHHILAAKQ